jgi:hypothetical protein
MDSVMAQTLSLKLDVIQTIDRMIATAEARRNGILREIDRHRETLRQDVRRAVQQSRRSSAPLNRKHITHAEHCRVTSTCKISSNRANARLSTGPRTPAGKSRSAKSALRHGLSLPIVSDPIFSEEVETLAREIAGMDASPEMQERARRISEAQMGFLSRAVLWPRARSRPCESAFRAARTLEVAYSITGATRSRTSSTSIQWRPLCARSWPIERNGREARPIFCRSAPTGLAGPRVLAHSLAGCGGHRPSCARSGLRLSSAARSGWERGQSG